MVAGGLPVDAMDQILLTTYIYILGNIFKHHKPTANTQSKWISSSPPAIYPIATFPTHRLTTSPAFQAGMWAETWEWSLEEKEGEGGRETLLTGEILLIKQNL